MKKFIFTGIATLFIAPAFATPTNTSSTFPANGYMQEDYTYTNQATYTNMGVYSDSVNADANYDNCPAGYWCDASGQHACSSLSGGYNSSDAGSTENTACYKSCTVATANIAHATAVVGNDYYGTGTDTCSATSCENGYHININGGIGMVAGGYANNNKYGYINNNGNDTYQNTTYGLTENGTFALEYANNNGTIRGRAQCSSQGVSNPWYGDANYTFSNDNFVSTLPDSTGQYCWCNVEEYTPVDGAPMSLSGPWVLGYDYGLASNCAFGCAYTCAYNLGDTNSNALAFRSAILGSHGVSAATCMANVITINWSGASQSDIDANNAGTVTYGGDIRTPRAAAIIPGKVFTGWTFSAPAEPID